MSVNITVAVPLDVIASIKAGPDLPKAAEDSVMIVKSVIDSIKALPYDIKAAAATTINREEREDDSASIKSFDSDAPASAPPPAKKVKGNTGRPNIPTQLQGTMSVHVRTRTGKTVTLLCSRHATVDDVKALFMHREGIPPDQQRLIFNSKQLDDGRTVSSYKIVEGSTIEMVLRLRGS